MTVTLHGFKMRDADGYVLFFGHPNERPSSTTRPA